MSKELSQLTTDDFRAYEKVRRSGAYNMITQAKEAMQIAGLDNRTYAGVQQHYCALQEKIKKENKENAND